MKDLPQGTTEAPDIGAVTPVPKPAALTILGKDNYGELRQVFADKIAALDDNEFVNFSERKIWLSAFANSNPRSDYHWQADACYDEAVRRGAPDLYKTAWENASRSAQ